MPDPLITVVLLKRNTIIAVKAFLKNVCERQTDQIVEGSAMHSLGRIVKRADNVGNFGSKPLLAEIDTGKHCGVLT